MRFLGISLLLPFLKVLFQRSLNGVFFGLMLPQSLRFFDKAHKMVVIYNKILSMSDVLLTE